jgi:hypothetical protein
MISKKENYWFDWAPPFYMADIWPSNYAGWLTILIAIAIFAGLLFLQKRNEMEGPTTILGVILIIILILLINKKTIK